MNKKPTDGKASYDKKNKKIKKMATQSISRRNEENIQQQKYGEKQYKKRKKLDGKTNRTNLER